MGGIQVRFGGIVGDLPDRRGSIADAQTRI